MTNPEPFAEHREHRDRFGDIASSAVAASRASASPASASPAEIDGTYGYDLAALLAVEPVPPPEGLADRWRGWYEEAMRVAPEPVLTRLAADDPLVQGLDRQVFEVEHTVSGGLRLRGWIALPVGGVEPRVGIVHGHGYGGRDALDVARVPDDAAVFFTLARGQGVLNAGLGAPRPEDGHVLHGIESVDDYVLGRCAVDLWHAASALVEVVGALPLSYVGESFGGGIGALAIPWDDRFVGATLIVPSFGQYDLRLQLPCSGSGELVREYVAVHPEAREVLRWFDASSTAGFFRIPVRVECALRDAHVPPPGQFAVAEAVSRAADQGTGAALELDVQPAGHLEYEGRADVLARAFAATREHIERSL